MSGCLQLKHLVDLGKVRAMVTGKGRALRIEAGRDSLAGRVQTIEMGPLLLREIAAVRGFGDVPACLPPNGLAPLKDKSFWKVLKVDGATTTATFETSRFGRSPNAEHIP